MIRDINIDNRKIYIGYASEESLYPHSTVFPDDELYPIPVTAISSIVQNSVKLSEIIADNDIKFGKLYSAMFEAEVYNIPDISGKMLIVYQEENGVHTNLFYGRVISCKQDNTGLDRKIVAYDMANELRDVNIAPWWINFWSNKQQSTIKACRDSLCEYMGILFEDVELINDNITISKNVDISYLSFADILFMLCELNGCFPHFNRDGILEFIMLDAEEDALDITGLYEGLNSEFEDFITDEITGIQFFDSENALKYTYGTSDNAYKIGSNILTYSMGTSQLNTIASNLLDYMSELRYTPARVKMIVGDLNYYLGQRLHTEKGDFYILENQYSASQLIEETVIAKGKQKQEENVRGIGNSMLIVDEKIARVEYSVEELSTEFADTARGLSSRITQNANSISSEVTRATGAENGLSSRITQTADSISTEITNRQNGDTALSSQITQTASQIRSEISQGDDALSSRITQTANSISTEVTRATTAEGSLSSRITQNANSISLKVDKNNVSSALTLDGGDIKLEGNRVYIDSDKFTLDWDGSIECEDATIRGKLITGDSRRYQVKVVDDYIKFNDDAYIDGGGRGAYGGMHLNADEVVFSVDNIGVTNSRGSSGISYGYTGNATAIYEIDDGVVGFITLTFINGICVGNSRD